MAVPILRNGRTVPGRQHRVCWEDGHHCDGRVLPQRLQLSAFIPREMERSREEILTGLFGVACVGQMDSGQTGGHPIKTLTGSGVV